jgi:hypothetical protein
MTMLLAAVGMIREFRTGHLIVMEAFPPVACEEALSECEPPHEVMRNAVARSRAKARIDFK